MVSRIQTFAKNLGSSNIKDGNHLKEINSYKYKNQKCYRIFKGSKYIYTGEKNENVDLLNAKDLTYCTTLDIDGKGILFAIEVND